MQTAYIRQYAKRLFPDFSGARYTGFAGIGGFVKKLIPRFDKSDEGRMNLTFGPNGFFGYCAASDDTLGWWCNVEYKALADPAQLDVISPEEWRARLIQLYGEYHDPIRPILQEAPEFISTFIHEVSGLCELETERKPRAERIIADARRRAANKQTMGPVKYFLMQRILSVILPSSVNGASTGSTATMLNGKLDQSARQRIRMTSGGYRSGDWRPGPVAPG